jgi:hypothetical protein
MPNERWTWDDLAHPGVARVLGEPAVGHVWCHQIEEAPTDCVVGKVLCVCAAKAVARAVLTAELPSLGASRQAILALELLESWIDDPTDERFDRICDLIFAEDSPLDVGPYGVVWWALRTATSSVGNFEAGWALASTCGAVENTGFTPEQLRQIVNRELHSRQRQTVIVFSSANPA